jgi:hypothetical protein
MGQDSGTWVERSIHRDTGVQPGKARAELTIHA